MRYINMLFVFKETLFSDNLPLFTSDATLIGNRALFIGNDDFNTGFENRFLQILFVVHPIFRVGAHDFYIGITGESLCHVLNILCERRIAEQIQLTGRESVDAPSSPSSGYLK